jgi:hypothetical protein
MPVATEWSEAEDAFLALSCEFVRDEHSVRFESAQPAARLNAVRILDLVGLDEAGWARTLGTHATAFATRELPLRVQLAEPLSGDDLPGEWRAAGAIYDHVATDIADFAGASPRVLDLRPIRSDADVEHFAEMMMQGRIPPPVRDRARPGLQRIMRASADRPGANLLLAYDGDDLVGQVALMEASGQHARGYTITTLSVDEAVRSQGYMKALYCAIARTFEGQLYGQITRGTPTMGYRQRFPSTRILASTRKYERVDDPYGDAHS